MKLPLSTITNNVKTNNTVPDIESGFVFQKTEIPEEIPQEMTKFKNTIAGKILKGVGIGAAVVGGAALIGATGGAAAPAVGLLGKAALGIGKVVKGAVKGASVVGKAAVNLVTGTTSAEREQVREVKSEAKDAQDQLDQVERLMKAGATRAKAEEMAGVSSYELGSANAAEKDTETTTKLDKEKLLTAGVGDGTGCAAVFICLLSLGCGLITALILLMIKIF